MLNAKRDIKKLFFDGVTVGLSAFVSLFLAFVVQASYNIFSYSAEASSIAVNYNATGYYGYVDSWTNQGVEYSNANMWLVMCSLALYAIFLCAFLVSIEYIGKASSSRPMRIMLSIVLIAVIVSWFVEPLIVLFSSTTNPNLIYRVAPGILPNSDAARMSYLFSELDHFQLFSVALNFSLRNLVLATSVLIAGLSLTRLTNILSIEHSGIRKSIFALFSSNTIRRTLFVLALLALTILPVVVYFFSGYPFSYEYYVGGPPSRNYSGYTYGSICIDGIGDVYLGEILHVEVLNDILMNSFRAFITLWIGLILASCIPIIRRRKVEILRASEKKR